MTGRLPLQLVAQASGVSLRTLRRWAADGRLTAERRGREYLIDPIELLQLEDLRTPAGRLPKSA